VKSALFLFFLFTVVAVGADEVPPVETSEEEFNPFFFGFLVLGLCIILFLLAASIVLGVAAALGIIVLVALGIVSASAVIGLLQRRFSSGLRAMHYQVCAAAALPAGIGVLWLGSYLFGLHLHYRYILMIGSIAGVCGGLLLAFTFDRIMGAAYRRFVMPRLPNA
jgi:hypothetical protein